MSTLFVILAASAAWLALNAYALRDVAKATDADADAPETLEVEEME